MLREAATAAFEAAKVARLDETRQIVHRLFRAWSDRMGLDKAEPMIYWERLDGSPQLLKFKIQFSCNVEDLEFRGAYTSGDADLTMTLEGFHGGQVHSLVDLGAALAPKER